MGILTAAVGTIPVLSGGILRNGAPFVVAVFLVIKGASRLRCRTSDVAFGAVALFLVILSKAVPSEVVSPIVFHVAALALLPIFASTGLTLKTIALDRQKKKADGIGPN